MAGTTSRTIHVLVIEGREGEFRRLDSVLASNSRTLYQIDHFDSRAAALEAIHGGKYDVILLTAPASDSTALELIREAAAESIDAPIVALTPSLDAQFEETAVQAGAADCLDLTDAVDSVRLERAISRAVRQATTRAELRESRRQLEQATKHASAAGERNRSAQLLHSILRNLPVIAGQLDASSRVVDAQGAGLLPQGIRPERLIGRVFTDLFPASRTPIAEALAGGASNFTLSGRARGKDWHAEFFVTFDGGQRAGATFFGRDITDRRWLEVNLLGASDAEQQRLGTDLHDGLGQQLTGLAFMAAALRDRLKVSLPAEVPQADSLARLARDATFQSRALARGLHPVQLEKHGLVAAMEELATQSQVLHNITCHFRMRGPLPTREHADELHLYRITQEAIRNAVRHGAGRNITVTLAGSSQHTHRLAITDDGTGFDPVQTRASTNGRGLRLMGYRAAMIGGTLSVESRPGHGTRIACLFSSPPSHENERAAQPSGVTSKVPLVAENLSRR